MVSVTPVVEHSDNTVHRHRHYVLIMVTLVYVLNYMNRQMVNVVLPQIKAEFHLSDTQLGLLAGPVFAVVYALLGLPLAQLADRVNRRKLIAATLVMFSAATFASGLVINYLQLLVARFTTGIGEAGTSPAAASMISDYYPPEQRATALSLYSGGLNLGLLIAFFGGGWFAQHYGWRAALMAAGLPGLPLLLLFLFTVSEPRRGQAESLKDTDAAPGLWSAFVCLASLRSFRYIVLGASLCAFAGYAGLSFNPLFLARTHHLTPVQIGTTLALLTGVFGFLGTLSAGWIADRLGKRDSPWGMYVSALGAILAAPFFPLVYLAPGPGLAIAAAVVPFALSTSYMGPSFAALQGLSPLRIRAKAQAIFLLLVNLIGLGLGPQWVGLMSDALRPALGNDSLRWAMLTTVVPLLGGGVSFWLAARAVRQDFARVRSDSSI